MAILVALLLGPAPKPPNARGAPPVVLLLRLDVLLRVDCGKGNTTRERTHTA